MARLPLISPLDRAVFLKAQPYLAGLPATSVAALAQHSEERYFSRGEEVFEAGVPPTTVYFLATGGMRTEYEGEGSFDITAPGGIGLVEHLAQSESPPAVQALDDCFALAVDVGSFMQIVEDDFYLYMTLARGLARAATESILEPDRVRTPECGFPEDQSGQTFATLDLVQRLARARMAPFFQGSNLTVLTELLRYQQPQVIAEGATLWQQDSAVESMALVLDGTLVTSRNHGQTHHPAGAMLGGWEIFTSQPRLETARAQTAARVIEIDGPLLMDVLEDHFEFAIDYLSKLCRRVIATRFQAGDHDG